MGIFFQQCSVSKVPVIKNNSYCNEESLIEKHTNFNFNVVCVCVCVCVCLEEFIKKAENTLAVSKLMDQITFLVAKLKQQPMHWSI